MKSVTQQWRKSVPPILSTSHCEFNGTVRAPTLEKPSPWHQFTRLLNKWYLHCIQNRWLEACPDRFPQFCARLIKGFLPPKTFLCVRRFFLCFIFIAHFRGVAGACVNPRSIFSNSLFVHSLLCQITHSFLNGQQFPHVCSTCHANFRLK